MGKKSMARRTFLRTTGAATTLLGATAPGALGSPRGERDRSGLPYDFDEVYSRVGTDSVRWDRAREKFPAVRQCMGVADMDFRAPPCVTRAVAERCAHENWGYLHRPAAYADAVAKWCGDRYDLDVDAESVVFTEGVIPGLIAALHTFAPPGSRVLFLTPAYSGFYTALRFTRTIAEECELVRGPDGSYSIDFDDFERRAGRCNAFILCNPQNPTGNCWSKEDLTRLGEICLEHRIPVLADEIHCDFVAAGHRFTPFAGLDNAEVVQNSVTFMSASKSFSIAAMKVAWYFSDNPSYLERVDANTRSDINTLGMVATRAALDEGAEWLGELIEYLDETHAYAASRINADLPLMRTVKPEGTYLLWLDARELMAAIGARRAAEAESRAGTEPVTPEVVTQRWLAENAGVYLNPGSDYGAGGPGNLRMNIASPRSVVRDALDGMAEALNAL